MIVGLLVLVGFLALGDAIASASPVPLPGNVVGMVLLALSLRAGWVRAAWVRPASEVLIRHMALFFVPPGVAIASYLELLGRSWVPIVVSSLVSAVLVLLVVGLLAERRAAA